VTARRRIALYVLALAASFGGGAALGAAVGPIEVVDEAPADHDGSGGHEEGSH
jgi:hypothetical protein